MALRDPGMLEFARFINTEESATEFAREHGLLLAGQVIGGGGFPGNGQNCALGTRGCTGIVNPGTRTCTARNKTYQGFRCSKCQRFRGGKNVLINGEIRGPRNSGEFRSFFATADDAGKSHTKMSIQKALVIVYCWSRNMSLTQTKQMLDSYGKK